MGKGVGKGGRVKDGNGGGLRVVGKGGRGKHG